MHSILTHSAWIQVTTPLFGPAALNEETSHFEKRKVFILVSTVMTWARSKPLDPVSSALAFLLCSIAASIPCNPHAERAFYSFQCAYTPELCPLISTPQRSWIGKPGVLHVSLCRTPGFDSWVGKILWRRKWQTTPVLCLENLMEGEHGRLQSMGSQRVGHD